jgi:hypothetical protein
MERYRSQQVACFQCKQKQTSKRTDLSHGGGGCNHSGNSKGKEKKSLGQEVHYSDQLLVFVRRASLWEKM